MWIRRYKTQVNVRMHLSSNWNLEAAWDGLGGPFSEPFHLQHLLVWCVFLQKTFCNNSCQGSHRPPWLLTIQWEAQLALFSILLAIKNQATGHYILNGKGEAARSRSFIDLGVEWEYNIEDDIETLHTDGPLHDAVVVLVGYLSSSGNMVGLSFIKSACPSWSLCWQNTAV